MKWCYYRLWINWHYCDTKKMHRTTEDELNSLIDHLLSDDERQNFQGKSEFGPHDCCSGDHQNFEVFSSSSSESKKNGFESFYYFFRDKTSNISESTRRPAFRLESWRPWKHFTVGTISCWTNVTPHQLARSRITWKIILWPMGTLNRKLELLCGNSAVRGKIRGFKFDFQICWNLFKL